MKSEPLTISIQCFGIAGEICGPTVEVALSAGSTIEQLHAQLRQEYPKLAELRHFFIAQNQEYADNDALVKAGDELVIIPPVSGG